MSLAQEPLWSPSYWIVRATFKDMLWAISGRTATISFWVPLLRWRQRSEKKALINWLSEGICSGSTSRHPSFFMIHNTVESSHRGKAITIGCSKRKGSHANDDHLNSFSVPFETCLPQVATSSWAFLFQLWIICHLADMSYSEICVLNLQLSNPVSPGLLELRPWKAILTCFPYLHLKSCHTRETFSKFSNKMLHNCLCEGFLPSVSFQ